MMVAKENNILLSLGHGYSARTLSRKLSEDPNWHCIGTTRTAQGRGRVLESGSCCRIWPGCSLREEIAQASHILVSVPPNDDHCHALTDPVLRSLSDCLAHTAGHLKWIGYLSTTAVYGDKAGNWVDEKTKTSPTTRRGQRRVKAENEWLDCQEKYGLPIHIFRLAGIYGPGRGPLAQILAGKKRFQVIRKGQIFNRIHAEDIAQVLQASMARPSPGSIYNVCDDCPAPPEDVTDFACQLLQRPKLSKIPFETATLSPMAKSFFSESKRVCNDYMKSELGVHLHFPDYRTGLRSLVETQSDP